VAERDEDKYVTATAFKCWACDPQNGLKVTLTGATQHAGEKLVDSIATAMSSARQSEVQAWEEEIFACEHTLTLQQFESGHIPASGMSFNFLT
jgi:ubiquitin carboxyl-terminal hydrolase 5/13